MPNSIFPRPLLRQPEAARLLGLAPQTLAALRVKGGGPPFFKLGRAVVYDPADLAAWVATKKRLSTSDYGAFGHD